MVITGSWLRGLRAEFGWTPTQMARRLAKTRQMVLRYEKNGSKVSPQMRAELLEVIDGQIAALAAKRAEIAPL